jgi:hypothetical protein
MTSRKSDEMAVTSPNARTADANPGRRMKGDEGIEANNGSTNPKREGSSDE